MNSKSKLCVLFHVLSERVRWEVQSCARIERLVYQVKDIDIVDIVPNKRSRTWL